MKNSAIILSSSHDNSEAFPHLDVIQSLSSHTSVPFPDFQFSFLDPAESERLAGRALLSEPEQPHFIVATDPSHIESLSVVQRTLRTVGHMAELISPHVLQIQIKARTSGACRTSLA